MISFPTLTVGLDFRKYKYTLAHDPTIRSQYAHGATQTRPTFTSTKNRWEIQFSYGTLADRRLLEEFQSNVAVGGDSFMWTDKEGENHICRLASPIEFTCEPRHFDKWRANISLVEA